MSEFDIRSRQSATASIYETASMCRVAADALVRHDETFIANLIHGDAEPPVPHPGGGTRRAPTDGLAEKRASFFASWNGR